MRQIVRVIFIVGVVFVFLLNKCAAQALVSLDVHSAARCEALDRTVYAAGRCYEISLNRTNTWQPNMPCSSLPHGQLAFIPTMKVASAVYILPKPFGDSSLALWTALNHNRTSNDSLTGWSISDPDGATLPVPPEAVFAWISFGYQDPDLKAMTTDVRADCTFLFQVADQFGLADYVCVDGHERHWICEYQVSPTIAFHRTDNATLPSPYIIAEHAINQSNKCAHLCTSDRRCRGLGVSSSACRLYHIDHEHRNFVDARVPDDQWMFYSMLH